MSANEPFEGEEAAGEARPLFDPPFEIMGSGPGPAPSALVFSSPHSGSCYPDAFLRL
ncbi:MAG: N-formylglutamate amidohydrolase, partial [Alphaproteobacteria bacterium]|nr:N-formylglutamate amidohydrolase [Alphaproteobacteria bacterium]